MTAGPVCGDRDDRAEAGGRAMPTPETVRRGRVRGPTRGPGCQAGGREVPAPGRARNTGLQLDLPGRGAYNAGKPPGTARAIHGQAEMTSRILDASPLPGAYPGARGWMDDPAPAPFPAPTDPARLRQGDLILAMPVGILAFLASLSMLGAYTAGDQLAYRAFYDKVHGVEAGTVPIVQAVTTGSAEPLYGYMIWGASNAGFDKDIFISVLNAIFAGLLFLFLRKHRVGALAMALIFTNFYLVTLFTSVERLKLAYIFLTAAALLTGWKAALALLLSMTAHFQSLIMIVAVIATKLGSRDLVRRHVTRNQLAYILLGLPVALAGFAVFALRFLPAIQGKIASYTNGSQLASLASIGLLLIVGLLVLRQKQAFVIGLLPLMLATVIFGAFRINILAVTLFLYLAIIERRTGHPAVIALLIYFSLKTIPFLENVYTWGDGYYGQ